LNLPANPHGYWLFGSLDFQSGNMISSQPRYDHFDTSPYDVTPFILLYSAGKCKGVEKGDWQKSKTFRKKRKKAIDYFRLMW